MAYLSKEQVAEIRKEIRAAFGKEWKFSITRSDYTGVRIVVLKTPLRLLDDAVEGSGAGETLERFGYVDVIEGWMSEAWTGETLAALKKIFEIAQRVGGGSYDRNAGDVFADYSNFTYYIDVSFGRWDRPCDFPRDTSQEAA